MAECAHCKAYAQLFESGVPICQKCAEAREVKRKPPQNTDQIRTALVSQIVEATAKLSAANKKFSETIGQFPSSLPRPDCVRRINDASNELTVARKEVMKAHTRLSEFIERGIVPEDLKQSG